jgi:succinoglycan biosynthesis transport protein ExoP
MLRNGDNDRRGLPSPAGIQPAHSPAREEGLIEQWLAILRRRRWVVLQALVIVPAAALVFSLLQEDKYTATASLLFRSASTETLPQGGTPGFVDPTREAATNDQLVSLPAVAQETAKLLRGRATAGDVAGSVTVDAGGEADIARITATTTSPRLSADMANAYGEAYIAFRRKRDQARLKHAIGVLERNLAALSAIEQAGPAGQAVQANLAQLKAAVGLQTGNADLVQRASAPSTPSSPKVKRNTLLGLILGGILGFLLAALLERLDRTVRSAEEIEELYGLPILARIPKSRALASQGTDQERPLDAATSHAFRALRANLHNFNAGRELRSVLVIGREPGGGKSTIARHLALTMAEVRDRVVLVEADLQKDRNGSEAGLSSVLTGAPLKHALTSVPLANESPPGRQLTVIPAGRAPANASELVGSEDMRSLLRLLEVRFDLVIVDSPPLAIASDALALVHAVSGVIVVCAIGQSTREGVRELRKQLMLVGCDALGIVANFATPSLDDYGYYYSRLRAVAHS